MLSNMHDLFTEKFHDPLKAWDSMLEFLAVDNNAALLLELDHKFEWLLNDKELSGQVHHAYNPELLTNSCHDHLGQFYSEKIASRYGKKTRGLELLTQSEADSLAKDALRGASRIPRVLDPEVSTGRVLLAAHKLAPHGLFFGVESDLQLLRIAATNFYIHDVTGYLLHADNRLHDTDPSTDDGQYNWQFCNSWHSQMDKLRLSLRTRNGRPHKPVAVTNKNFLKR